MRADLLPIVSHIPIPPKRITRSSGFPSTLKAMKAGDSCLVKMYRNSPYLAAKRLGIKICVRSMGDGWLRVWRTE